MLFIRLHHIYFNHIKVCKMVKKCVLCLYLNRGGQPAAADVRHILMILSVICAP